MDIEELRKITREAAARKKAEAYRPIIDEIKAMMVSVAKDGENTLKVTLVQEAFASRLPESGLEEAILDFFDILIKEGYSACYYGGTIGAPDKIRISW